ncbi:MAG: CZB domain-containing protein [Alphaproteobacteria bacterium]|nr:CZB domain-containing protein [Alphaproteobacteria bacterium]
MSSMVNQIDAAIESHKSWKARLAGAIECGTCDDKPGDIVMDQSCVFGQWLYGDDIPVGEKSGTSYEKVKTWHALFHKEAGYVVELIRQGKIDEAKLALREEGQRYYQASSVLLHLLEEWKERITAGGKS